MSIVEFRPVDGRVDCDWPAELVGNGFVVVTLTENDIPLNGGEATYRDELGERYIVTRLRTGQYVADVRDD